MGSSVATAIPISSRGVTGITFIANRRLEWVERRPDGTTVIYHDEPRASLGLRLAVTLFGLLPIEGLL